MTYFSEIWGVDVRDEIVAEFTSPDGTVDDNLAGLHEVRALLAERSYHHEQPTESTATPADMRTALEGEGWRLLSRGKNPHAA